MLRILGALLVACGLAVALYGDDRLTGTVRLGGAAVSLGSVAAFALAGAAAVPALLRRPLGPSLLVAGPVLAFALSRHGAANWTHVVWRDAAATSAPTALAIAAALLVPAGILLAHAAARRAQLQRDLARRGVAGEPTARRAVVPILAAVGAAAPLALLAFAPELPSPGMLAGGLALALALAAAVGVSGSAIRTGGAGSTSRQARRSARAPSRGPPDIPPGGGTPRPPSPSAPSSGRAAP